MAEPLAPPSDVASVNIRKGKSFSFRTKADQRLHEEVNADVRDMIEYAKPARDRGREAIQGYMAIALQQSNKVRSRLFLPTIHAMVYSRIAMEAANVPKVEYKHRSGPSAPLMKYLNAARKHSEQGDLNLRAPAIHQWFHQNFDKVLLGNGFRFQGYHHQKREVHVKDDAGKWKAKTMIVSDDILDLVPDFFNVGVDRSMQPGCIGGRAMYWDRFFHKDTFRETFDDGFHENLDKVPEREWFQGESDNTWNIPRDYYRVRFYWNLYKDLYYVQANGVPIRNDYILDYGSAERPEKFLPFDAIHNEVAYEMEQPYLANVIQGGRQYVTDATSSTNKSFYHMGDAYIVKGLVGVENTILRAAADITKASSVHFLLAQSIGIYDQVRTADLYGVVPIKDADGKSFDVKSMVQNSEFLARWPEMHERVKMIMKGAIGNDWERAASELTNEKATVAAIRQQVQRLRMSFGQKFNSSAGVQKHYRIRLNLIQQYYTEPNVIPVQSAADVPDDVDEKDVERDGEGKVTGYRVYKEIPFDRDVVEIKEGDDYRLVTPDHEKAKGKDSQKSFKSRPSYLMTKDVPEIFIEDDSSFAELKALDRSLDLEFVQTITQFFQLAYAGKPVIPEEGARYIVGELAKKWDKDPDKLLGKEEKQAPRVPPPPGMPDPQGQQAVPAPMPSPAAAGQPPMNPQGSPAGQMLSSITQH